MGKIHTGEINGRGLRRGQLKKKSKPGVVDTFKDHLPMRIPSKDATLGLRIFSVLDVRKGCQRDRLPRPLTVAIHEADKAGNGEGPENPYGCDG